MMWSTNCCGRRILGWLGELDNLKARWEWSDHMHQKSQSYILSNFRLSYSSREHWDRILWKNGPSKCKQL